MGLFDFFKGEKKETLDKGLEKTRESVVQKNATAFARRSTVDDGILDN